MADSAISSVAAAAITTSTQVTVAKRATEQEEAVQQTILSGIKEGAASRPEGSPTGTRLNLTA